MYFNDINSLLGMGGHGLYVWSAYGITLLVIVYNIVFPILMKRSAIRLIHRYQERKKWTQQSNVKDV